MTSPSSLFLFRQHRELTRRLGDLVFPRVPEILRRVPEILSRVPETLSRVPETLSRSGPDPSANRVPVPRPPGGCENGGVPTGQARGPVTRADSRPIRRCPGA